ncbi:hypothetical protein ETP1_015 [Edwardsiella phage ETP-1]|uniref:Uncharacterized protein n=2 Tax=Kafunavirus KF1 TaxID=1982588 RepID=A0A6G5P4B1_9CAUD|nr:hypothetical protein ETP1_015 [Edwardsiella phage ETP-1]UIS54072.1 hypothetical protein ZHX_gp12 [Edwardsiella phage vB_EpP_ZHX]BAM63114.1 hypothetical protein [Edwardsiella phage IW-1]
MSTIKKAYQAIVEVLQNNASAVVSDVLPQVIELASAKTAAGGGKPTTFHRDDAGNVVAIKCYYHGLWMDPRVAEFGEKKTSASGFNSMSKDGSSKWTKQNAAAKKAKEELLTRVQSGEVAPEAIASEMAAIDAARQAVVAREDGYGFEALEECLADSAARGL